MQNWSSHTCNRQAQLTLDYILCANPYLIHAKFTALFHFLTTASRINTPFNRPFIFLLHQFQLFQTAHKNTFSFFSNLFLYSRCYFTQMLLAGKFSLEIKLYSALILQELVQIPFCPRALLSPQMLIGVKIPIPLLYRQTTKSITFSIALSLLFKYPVTKLPQQY